MRIAVVATFFPAWSETFIKREVMALVERGHEVAVFTETDSVPGPATDGVPGVNVGRHTIHEVRGFRPDVIYGQMGYRAQVATTEIARYLNVPYALRLWSGLDSLGLPARCVPLYENLHKDNLCHGVLVEDDVVYGVFQSRLRIKARMIVVPNSLFLEGYGNPAPGVEQKRNVVLAVGRFAKKKGFIHLVRAVKMVPDAELWLVGSGDEKARLETEMNHQVHFWGARAEVNLRNIFYCTAGVLCAPCVQMPGGDADGVPTVVLEAMASGLPVIASNLLSMPAYVHGNVEEAPPDTRGDKRTGFLHPPGDEKKLAELIDFVIHDHYYADQVGDNARAWANENLDIRKNIVRIEQVLSGAEAMKGAA